MAEDCGRDWTFGIRGILGANVLPGLIQHAYRAELYAVAFTLHHAACQNAAVTIWTDNQGVVSRFLMLTSGRATLGINTAHSDLWQWVLDSVIALGKHRVILRKVLAHQDVTKATTVQEAWRFWNNHAADRVATKANYNRPDSVWKLWTQCCQEWKSATMFSQQVQALQVAVAERSVMMDTPEFITAMPPPQPKETRAFAKHYDMPLDRRWFS